jgi:hypothetical protein
MLQGNLLATVTYLQWIVVVKYCNVMSPVGRKRNGNKDNLVPVKEVFPHKQKGPKPLVASLEVWWCSNKILELPKGGLDTPCSLACVRVHSVLEIALFCSLRALFYR